MCLPAVVRSAWQQSGSWGLQDASVAGGAGPCTACGEDRLQRNTMTEVYVQYIQVFYGHRACWARAPSVELLVVIISRQSRKSW